MRFISYENLNGWKPIEMSMMMEAKIMCPVCDIPLLVIAVLKGKLARVRVGVCDMCGYMGYIDQPKAEWFAKFYKDQWDEKGKKEAEETAELLRTNFEAFRPNHLSQLLRRIQGKGTFLEVGSGFGYNLLDAQKLGFEVSGVESSEHRAKVCEDSGFKIYRGVFEDLDIKGRFNIIGVHHVLEHVKDLNKFIKKCSELQEPEDFILIAVPNNLGEPTMGVLTFLPHLHSFTVCAISRLLAKYGYEASDFTLTNERYLNVIAIRRKDKVGQIPIGGFSGDKVRKIIKGLDMQKRILNPKRRLVWSKLKDDAKQLPLKKFPQGFIDPRSFIIKQGKVKFPLIIEYGDYPIMFVK